MGCRKWTRNGPTITKVDFLDLDSIIMIKTSFIDIFGSF